METKTTFTIDLTGWRGVAAGLAIGGIVGTILGIYGYYREVQGIKRGVNMVCDNIYDRDFVKKEKEEC